MNRPSNTALLLAGAFSVPIIVELRTLLGLVGVEIAWQTALFVGVAWFALLGVIAAFPGARDPNAAGG